MSATKAEDTTEAKKKGGKGKLIIIVVVALALLGAGGWFSGIIPGLLGGKKTEAAAEAGEHAAVAATGSEKAAPIFLDLPDIVANLNSGARRSTFVKLRAKLELARKEDVATVTNAMPRVLDLFQSYLREMRPEELRGTAGTYRLREELIGRTNVAAAPAHVLDVLFVELLVQ